MKSKQEVIQEAWGKYWGKVKDHVDKNGKLKYVHCWQIFGDGIKSDRNFYDHELQDKQLNLQNCEWDMAYYPKAIEGLSNNNGWTRIESEAELPQIAGYDFKRKYFTIVDGKIRDDVMFNVVFGEWRTVQGCKITKMNVTHYMDINIPPLPIF